MCWCSREWHVPVWRSVHARASNGCMGIAAQRAVLGAEDGTCAIHQGAWRRRVGRCKQGRCQMHVEVE